MVAVPGHESSNRTHRLAPGRHQRRGSRRRDHRVIIGQLELGTPQADRALRFRRRRRARARRASARLRCAVPRDAASRAHAPLVEVAGDDPGAHHQVAVPGDGGGDPVDVGGLALGDLTERQAVEAPEAEDRGPRLVEAGQAGLRRSIAAKDRAGGLAGPQVRSAAVDAPLDRAAGRSAGMARRRRVPLRCGTGPRCRSAPSPVASGAAGVARPARPVDAPRRSARGAPAGWRRSGPGGPGRAGRRRQR